MKRFKTFLLAVLFMSVNFTYITKTDYVQKAYAKGDEADTIKILEIVPDYLDPSQISDLNGKIIFDNKIASVTSITLNQFISMRDDVDGEEDIIYFSAGHYGLVKGYYDDSNPCSSGINYPQRRYNDITNLRALAIKDMINKGRCVIIHQDALKDTSSKMYQNFSIYKNNIVSSINIDILKNLYSTSIKRPQIINVGMPKDYYESGNRFSISFNVLSLNNASTYTANFYIDTNRDNLFKDDEKKVVKTSLKFGEQNGIVYDLPLIYTANLYWKLEIIEDGTYAKNIIEGAFKYKGQPIDAKVLQISPEKSYKDIVLNLNTELNKNITEKDGRIHPLCRDDGFNISVEDVTSTDFQNAFINKKDSNYQKFKNLGANYDMLIFGFSDNYAGGDIKNSDALQAIRDYYSTGQGLMLTHDTIWYVQDSDQSISPVNISRNFVKDAGQAFENKNLYKDLIDEHGWYFVGPWPWNWEYGIKASDIYTYNPPKQLGLPTQYMQYTYYRPLNNSSIPYHGNNYTSSSRIKMINKGIITDYPYDLSSSSTINIAMTHDMYYTLNLEDPDVLPWYNLDVNSNQKDATNSAYYYYTYSTKNITFSGTGHSPSQIKNNPDKSELKLFVNTIIKGFLSANHKPDILIDMPLEGQNISNSDDFIEISFTPYDYDLNDADDIKVKIYLEGAGDTYTFDKLQSGKKFETAVPNPYKGKPSGYKKISFEAVDKNLAAVQKDVTINVVDTPMLPKALLSYNKFQNTHNPVIGGFVTSTKKDRYKVRGRILDYDGKEKWQEMSYTNSDGSYILQFSNIPDTEDFSKPYRVMVKLLPNNDKEEKESEENEGYLYIDTIKPAISDLKINGIDVSLNNTIKISGDYITITCNVNDNDPKLISKNKNMMLEWYDTDENVYKDLFLYQTVKNGFNEYKPMILLKPGRYRFTIEAEDRAGNNTKQSFEFNISNSNINNIKLEFGSEINRKKAGSPDENVITADNGRISIKLTVEANDFSDISEVNIPVYFGPNNADGGFYDTESGYIYDICHEGYTADRSKVEAVKVDNNITYIKIHETIPKGSSYACTFFVKPRTSSSDLFKDIYIKLRPEDTVTYTSHSNIFSYNIEEEKSLKIKVIKTYLR